MVDRSPVDLLMEPNVAGHCRKFAGRRGPALRHERDNGDGHDWAWPPTYRRAALERSSPGSPLDNVDRLQNRLSTLPRAGASFRLGLRRRIPAAEAIDLLASPGRSGNQKHQWPRFIIPNTASSALQVERSPWSAR